MKKQRTWSPVAFCGEVLQPPVGESSVLSISLADTEDNTVSSTIYSTLRCSASHGVKRNLKNSQNHP